MSSTNNQYLTFGKEILDYCERFNVPQDYLLEILTDQKVLPMIRGKATEYNLFVLLDSTLKKSEWSVQKLNLNAQTSVYDEDISITHRRTGIILKVESKNAVRGSFRDGRTTRNLDVPHFKVKCHRSRSNISLSGTSNDRYSDDSFDLLVSNTSNAIFQGGTIGEDFEIVSKGNSLQVLSDFYKTDNDSDLIKKCEQDWRFCIPTDISEDGFLPRTPYVRLEFDPNWFSLDELPNRLLSVVEQKRNNATSQSRR